MPDWFEDRRVGRKIGWKIGQWENLRRGEIKAGVPLTDYKSQRVRSRWFDWMKFAPIIFHRYFWSHCPTRTKSHRGNRKLPPIVGPKYDMADYCRLPPIIIYPQFFIRFPPDPPILRSVGQWDAGLTRQNDSEFVRNAQTAYNLSILIGFIMLYLLFKHSSRLCHMRSANQSTSSELLPWVEDFKQHPSSHSNSRDKQSKTY